MEKVQHLRHNCIVTWMWDVRQYKTTSFIQLHVNNSATHIKKEVEKNRSNRDGEGERGGGRGRNSGRARGRERERGGDSWEEFEGRVGRLNRTLNVTVFNVISSVVLICWQHSLFDIYFPWPYTLYCILNTILTFIFLKFIIVFYNDLTFTCIL